MKLSKHLNMISIQKITKSHLKKWRFFQSRNVPMVSFETDEEVFVFVESEDKENVVKFNKVAKAEEGK